ncbi:hypothetical protein C4553_02850 [Candidatus Parcubacteria bacterium]|nr:MAG: hypothetical protein C4553_02850 [Candidatus Parcubacteria bacterium]
MGEISFVLSQAKAQGVKILTARFKRWLVVFCLVMTTGLVGAIFGCPYAPAFTYTFINGESAIAWWLGLGVSAHLAIAVAISCSTCDIFGWFYLANDPDSFFQKYLQARIERGGESDAWVRRLAHKLPYTTLPLFGFIPGLIFVGIPLSKKLGLNQKVSFVLIVLGNAFKMLAFGMGIKVGFGFLLRLFSN